MKYMQWKLMFDSETKLASLEIFDVIRAAGGFVDALHTTPELEVVCIISDDVDLSIIDSKWEAREISQKRVINLLKGRDPQVFLRPDGTPVYPTEILKYEFPTVPVEYI